MIDTDSFIRVSPDGTIRGVHVTDARGDCEAPQFITIGGADYVASLDWFRFIVGKQLRAQPGDTDIVVFEPSRRPRQQVSSTA
jgi:hypothetical protein